VISKAKCNQKVLPASSADIIKSRQKPSPSSNKPSNTNSQEYIKFKHFWFAFEGIKRDKKLQCYRVKRVLMLINQGHERKSRQEKSFEELRKLFLSPKL